MKNFIKGFRFTPSNYPAEVEAKIQKYRKQGYKLPPRKVLRTPEQLEGIRESAKINTALLDYISENIREGMSTEEIDVLVYDFTTSHGAIPAPLNYEGFPKSVCTSINDVVCHGIPNKNEILKSGDIINVDVSTIYKGYFSDASRMFMIGDVNPDMQKLVQVTKECMEIGIAAAQPWKQLGDVGAAIQEHAEKNGFSVVRDLCGHGVGMQFHEEPDVEHFGRRGTGMMIVPGMTFTIEPMINMGTYEGFYEVDVNTLEVKELYQDGNKKQQKKNDTDAGPINALLPGVHGKGLYSGQGCMYFTNNGEGTQEALKKFDVEAGVLAEWNGKEWKVVRRNQFVEVTGPGGIYGNTNPETDPIWATGWDYKSVILGVRDAEKGWAFYRLPKASHSYDGAHGWNTEWPRIRNVGTESQPDYLMTMHGMFWYFPGMFTADNSAGIRPRSAYLKVIGDFTRWNDQLVFGCDDSAQKEFLNKRKAKGSIEGPGQSNSNLWFTSLTRPDELGPATAEGAVWAKESVKAGESSEPFLFSGWTHRFGWVKNEGKQPVIFTFEIDEAGKNEWKTLKSVTVNAGKSVSVPFASTEKGEWIRVKTDKNTLATVSFNYTTADPHSTSSDPVYPMSTSHR